MPYKSIGDYGVIGNMLSVALVGVDGSIDWCCLPRFDSPSIFAAILDDEIGGRFRVGPGSDYESFQAYLPDTNVLRTTFTTAEGTAIVTDFMPCYKISGRGLTQYNQIHRLVECTGGEVSLEAVFEPRLDYARDSASLEVSKYGVTAKGKTGSVALSAPAPFTVQGDGASCSFRLRRDEKAHFILAYGRDRPRPPVSYRSADKLERTTAYWREKAESCVVAGPWRDAIVRSYLALHLLVYSPTGAIVAAPTTSLPEEIGGERNWDYRFAWLRDASLTMDALFSLGHLEEALGFFNWLVTSCSKCGARAQILHDIDGDDPLDERQLDHLKGYRGSRPVRIGNGAHNQVQLDVFGEVLEAAHNYLNMSGYIPRGTWELLESFVNAACDQWREPDSGIWEVRGGPFHFVHSKLMCWVAVDRGIRIAERLGRMENAARWAGTAEEIREEVIRRGWNAHKRAFTQHYDTAALDASNLLMPLYGFLPVTDERIVSTVERTVEELALRGLVRRYRTDETDDGLPGSEGAFLWCSFWLVRNWLRMGKLEEARRLYERLLGYHNHLGLLAEMVDPESGEALGNFPQGLTHLAVIATGLELTRALDDDHT